MGGFPFWGVNQLLIFCLYFDDIVYRSYKHHVNNVLITVWMGGRMKEYLLKVRHMIREILNDREKTLKDFVLAMKLLNAITTAKKFDNKDEVRVDIFLSPLFSKLEWEGEVRKIKIYDDNLREVYLVEIFPYKLRFYVYNDGYRFLVLTENQIIVLPREHI